MHSENIVFVLVRPIYLGNIGSVARVMKNFGLRRLRLVEPPRNYKDAEARKMAVGAFDILKESQVFSSLSDALKDVSYSVGTTSGQQRENAPVPLRSITEIIKQRKDELCALVFGDERNGLSRDELDRCHQVMSVPTDPNFAALNLAQAVAICAYELGTQDNSSSPFSSSLATQHPTGEQDDEIFEQLGLLFDKVEFSRSFNRENVLTELRTFYQRAQPTAREAALLKGALHCINRNTQAKI